MTTLNTHNNSFGPLNRVISFPLFLLLVASEFILFAVSASFEDDENTAKPDLNHTLPDFDATMHHNTFHEKTQGYNDYSDSESSPFLHFVLRAIFWVFATAIQVLTELQVFLVWFVVFWYEHLENPCEAWQADEEHLAMAFTLVLLAYLATRWRRSKQKNMSVTNNSMQLELNQTRLQLEAAHQALEAARHRNDRNTQGENDRAVGWEEQEPRQHSSNENENNIPPAAASTGNAPAAAPATAQDNKKNSASPPPIVVPPRPEPEPRFIIPISPVAHAASKSQHEHSAPSLQTLASNTAPTATTLGARKETSANVASSTNSNATKASAGAECAQLQSDLKHLLSDAEEKHSEVRKLLGDDSHSKPKSPATASAPEMESSKPKSCSSSEGVVSSKKPRTNNDAGNNKTKARSNNEASVSSKKAKPSSSKKMEVTRAKTTKPSHMALEIHSAVPAACPLKKRSSSSKKEDEPLKPKKRISSSKPKSGDPQLVQDRRVVRERSLSQRLRENETTSRARKQNTEAPTTAMAAVPVVVEAKKGGKDRLGTSTLSLGASPAAASPHYHKKKEDEVIHLD